MSIGKIFKNIPLQKRAAVCFMMCSFLYRGVTMITTPLFTRIMSTEEYGQFNVYNSWLGIIAIIVSISLYQGMYVQSLVKFEKERSILSSSLQGLNLTLIAFWFIIYFLSKSFWNRLFSFTTFQMICMFILIWTSAVFGFWSNEQRVIGNYKGLLFVSIALFVLKPLISAFFVIKSDDKVQGRIIGNTVIELILFSGLFFFQMIRGKKFYSAKFWKYALSYNIPLIPHYLSQTILNNSDRIMIKNINGSREAGLYSLAYTIALVVSVFTTALSQTMAPSFYRRIKEKETKALAPLAYNSMIFIAIMSLIIIILAPEILYIFAPSEYKDALEVIPPVAMGVFFLYCYDIFAKHAFYYEKTIFVMLASVVGAGLNILLNLFFLEKYGYIAAAYTTLFCYIVYSFCHFIFMQYICKKYCEEKYPYEVKKLLLIMISYLLIGFVFAFTYRYQYIRYLIISGTAICVIIKREVIKRKLKIILNEKE